MKQIIDLRAWLDEVERMGELKHLEGVDWDQEIGCISELNRKENAPALLFDKIKGYPAGYRVLTSSVRSLNRTALSLGLSGVKTNLELLDVIRHKLPQWESVMKDFPPQVVKDAPILENVHSGNEIDLFEFPVPKYHEMDGGRYIGTGDAVITRDPDTGKVNLGTYRIMVHDKKTTALYISPGKDGRIHYEKHHQQGKPSPIAISFGHHPLMLITAARPSPGPEYNFAGAIRGEPVRVIIDEVTGLPIPADSEIVIVGWSPVGKTRIEGPFGEWTGYYASKDRPAPILEVERVYHRNNPIILGAPPSRPPSETSYCMDTFASAIVHNDLIKQGVPDVKGVWFNVVGGRTLVTVSIKQRYPGHAKQAAILASQSRIAAYFGRYSIVVDDDIDPSNLDEVIWALCFRTDPEKDIDIVRQAWSTPLDPTIRKPTNAYYNSRAIINACKPYDWIDEFPKVVDSNPQVAARMKEKWGKLLGI